MNGLLCVAAMTLSGVLGHAQVPEVYTVHPKTARAGEMVSIFGEDFDPIATNNLVHFGGVRAQVSRSWVTELEVEVPRGVQAGAVTVATRGRMGLSSTPFLPLFAPLGETNTTFARRHAIPGPSTFTPVAATADLDGDGDVELIVSGPNSRLDIFEYIDTGALISTSSFRLAASLPGNRLTGFIVPMDLDADGKLDLLTSASNSSGLVLFRNIHAGGGLTTNSFAPALRQNLFPPIQELHLADVDRDGRTDLVVREVGGVSLFRNVYDPEATNAIFQGPIRLAPGGVERPVLDMAVGDLNNDGHVEVVAIEVRDLVVYSHNRQQGDMGTNSFNRITLQTTNLFSVEIADVQGDGWLDILSYSRFPNAYDVHWNKSFGGHVKPADFQRVRIAASDPFVSAPKLIDLNGDTFPELISRPGFYYPNQSALLGDLIFAGTYLPSSNRWDSQLPTQAATLQADLNADGAQDLLMLGFGGVVIYQNVSELRPQIARLRQINDNDGNLGLVQLELMGRPNEMVLVQGSSDLQFWGRLSQVRLNSSGEANYVGVGGGEKRFFIVQPSASPR